MMYMMPIRRAISPSLAIAHLANSSPKALPVLRTFTPQSIARPSLCSVIPWSQVTLQSREMPAQISPERRP